MRFCFIIEEQYRHDSMPLVVARQLMERGHNVGLLEPSTTVTSLSTLAAESCHAYVLKTVSDGPGLSILQAAEASGIATINSSRAIRLVRDKAIFAAFAHAHGLPVPPSYFMVHPRLLKEIPPAVYPLVLKPANGSSGRGIYLLNSPGELAAVEVSGPSLCFFLAQRYVENPGHDIKLYVIGREVFAVAKKSPLHPDKAMESHAVPVKPEWHRLARCVCELAGLEIYGLDILETNGGPVIVDVNDFPSFGGVPGAASGIADYIVELARDSQRARGWPVFDRRGAQAMNGYTVREFRNSGAMVDESRRANGRYAVK